MVWGVARVSGTQRLTAHAIYAKAWHSRSHVYAAAMLNHGCPPVTNMFSRLIIRSYRCLLVFHENNQFNARLPPRFAFSSPRPYWLSRLVLPAFFVAVIVFIIASIVCLLGFFAATNSVRACRPRVKCRHAATTPRCPSCRE